MWVKLDDNFADHPKIIGLSDAAFRLHIEALAYCARYLTDGFVPRLAVPRRARPIGELLDAGLWSKDTAAGYRIHDWEDYNPSREAVLSKREQRSTAARKAAQARWGTDADGDA